MSTTEAMDFADAAEMASLLFGSLILVAVLIAVFPTVRKPIGQALGLIKSN